MSHGSLKTRRSTGLKQMDPTDVRRVRVEAHVGSPHDYMLRHQYELEALRQEGRLEECVPSLFERIDERAIYFGIDTTRSKNPAPGPDRVRLNLIPEGDLWRWARECRDAIRNGHYQPERPRKVKIPKPNGSTRTIHVFNHVDSAVQRGIMGILNPAVDPTLSEICHGGRPGRGTWSARKQLITRHRETNSNFLIVEDLVGAFDHVPARRLLQIVEKRIPCKKVINLLATIIHAQPRVRKTIGISQGAVLSPMMLNIYLDYLLDTRVEGNPEVDAAIRYIDDIALLCRSEESAHSAYETLDNLIRNAGLTPKYGPAKAIHDLTRKPARWLGHELRIENGRLQLHITEEAWFRLEDALSQCAKEGETQQSAEIITRNWLNDAVAMGNDKVRPICTRIQQLMRTHSFSPTPRSWLEEWSEEAIARWEEYLNSQVQPGSSYVEQSPFEDERTGRYTYWNDQDDTEAPYRGCAG